MEDLKKTVDNTQKSANLYEIIERIPMCMYTTNVYCKYHYPTTTDCENQNTTLKKQLPLESADHERAFALEIYTVSMVV